MKRVGARRAATLPQAVSNVSTRINSLISDLITKYRNPRDLNEANLTRSKRKTNDTTWLTMIAEKLYCEIGPLQNCRFKNRKTANYTTDVHWESCLLLNNNCLVKDSMNCENDQVEYKDAATFSKITS